MMHSTSQVPCKFFAEGRCRFGASCRFSHGQSGFGTVGYGGGGSFQQQQQVTASDYAKQYAAIEESMQKDMYEWEKGKIWPFSSYGPAGNRASIPGFEDLSMEELRFETMSSGQVPAHVTQRLMQLQRLRSMIAQDRSMARNLIDQAYKPDQTRHQTQTQQPQHSSLYSLLAKPTSMVAPSIFGGGSSSSSQSASLSGGGLFGQTPGNVNPFQQQSHQQPSQSIFGTNNLSSASFPSATPAQPQQQNLFGQGQTASASSGSIFGGTAGSQAPAFGSQSAFGSFPASASVFMPAAQPQQQQQQASSIFGGSGRGAAMPASVSAFGQSNLTSSSSIFGTSASMPQQSQQQQQPSIFGAQVQLSPASASASSFGTPQAFGTDVSQFVFKPQPTMASTPIQNQPSLLNAPGASALVSPRDKFVYSDMSELMPEDIAAYEADSFTSCENIPLKAPPKELCR